MPPLGRVRSLNLLLVGTRGGDGREGGGGRELSRWLVSDGGNCLRALRDSRRASQMTRATTDHRGRGGPQTGASAAPTPSAGKHRRVRAPEGGGLALRGGGQARGAHACHRENADAG